MGCYYKNESQKCSGPAIFRDLLGNQCCFDHFSPFRSAPKDDKVDEKKDKFIIIKPGFVNEDDDKVALACYDPDGDDYRFVGYLRYGDAYNVLEKLNKE